MLDLWRFAVRGQLRPFSAASACEATESRDEQSKLQITMETQDLLVYLLTFLALVAALVLFGRCKCTSSRCDAPKETAAPTSGHEEITEVKKGKNKRTKTPLKAGHNIPDTTNRHTEAQVRYS